MSDLFSKLGQLAQQAGLSGQNVQQQGKNAATGVGDFLGSLKDSVPGGVGGLLGAGALGGILGTLMSGKTAKKVGEGLLVAGGTAAAATLAWKLYQKWQTPAGQSQPQATQIPQGSGWQQPAPQGSGWQQSAPQQTTGWQQPAQMQPALSAATDPTAMLVLTAMVFASRADGFVDNDEKANVHATMEQLFPGTDVALQMDKLMNCPIDPHELARQVTSPEQGRDVYRLSCMVIVRDQAMEKAYLDALAGALGIAPDEQRRLEAEVDQMKG